MVGDAAQQAAAGHVVQPGKLFGVDVAFIGQLRAEIGNTRVLYAGGEVQQHAVGAEIVERFRLQVFDTREGAVLQQARPVIVGAHLHAPLVLPDGGGRRVVDAVILGGIVTAFVLCAFQPGVEIAPQVIHDKGHSPRYLRAQCT